MSSLRTFKFFWEEADNKTKTINEKIIQYDRSNKHSGREKDNLIKGIEMDKDRRAFTFHNRVVRKSDIGEKASPMFTLNLYCCSQCYMEIH